MTATPRTPKLALRVGITGTRKLTEAQAEKLRPTLTRMLELVRDEATRLAQCESVAPVYTTPAQPVLRFISPLAAGSDRFAADVAHELGYQLFVPMPFAQAEYENDFETPENLAEFRRMLAWADGATLQLDGGRAAAGDASRSYEAVGRFVARNSDLLIAIWDGQPGKGRGGTADIVRFATEFGPPIWRIDPDAPHEPALLEVPLDLRNPPDLKRGAAAETAVKALLRALIVPPDPPQENLHGLMSRFVHKRKQRKAGNEPTPLETYLREPAPHACNWSWIWLHDVVMKRSAWMAAQARRCLQRCEKHPRQSARWIGIYAWRWVAARPARRTQRRQQDHNAAANRPDMQAADYWQGFYADATTRAGDYASRYRSSYVLVFVFGAWALSFAVLGLAAESLHLWMAVLELLSLLAILGLVHVNHWHRWHQRWIEYRLLAELCRKQQALARVGWSLETWETRRMTQSGTRDPPRVAWAAWFFNAAMRAAPFPRGELAGPALADIRETLLQAPVQEQWQYHLRRARRSLRAGQFFGYAGEGLFVLTLAIVVVKLGVMGLASLLAALGFGVAGLGGGAHWLGVAAGVVPALSAAFVGIRAYAELEVMSEQSNRMAQSMASAVHKLRRIDPSRPLATQDLGAGVFDVATLMLQDVEGWVQLFQVKVVAPQ